MSNSGTVTPYRACNCNCNCNCICNCNCDFNFNFNFNYGCVSVITTELEPLYNSSRCFWCCQVRQQCKERAATLVDKEHLFVLGKGYGEPVAYEVWRRGRGRGGRWFCLGSVRRTVSAWDWFAVCSGRTYYTCGCCFGCTWTDLCLASSVDPRGVQSAQRRSRVRGLSFHLTHPRCYEVLSSLQLLPDSLVKRVMTTVASAQPHPLVFLSSRHPLPLEACGMD